jgi:hypothetical protein
MPVIRDDGLYRHLRFSRPDSAIMRFDLVTWPGYLAYVGDMGDYVFTRTPDMFQFFRAHGNLERINPHYWAEKCVARDRDGIEEFDEDLFKSQVMECLVEWIRDRRDETTKDERRELWEAVVDGIVNAAGDGGGWRKQIAANDFSHRVNDRLEFSLVDFWEVSVTKYTHRYVWCCYALVWGVHRYDEANKTKDQA